MDDIDRTTPDTVQPEDQTLRAAFAKGDHEAFSTLYRRHSRSIFQFASYVAGDAAQADELTQQVLVWLINNPAAFDPTLGTLPAFLGGVAAASSTPKVAGRRSMTLLRPFTQSAIPTSHHLSLRLLSTQRS